jgi:DNA-binding transcriptional LysR family regulator
MGLITNPAHGLIEEEEVDFDALKTLKFVLPTHVLGIRRLIDAYVAGKAQLTIEMECNSLATTLELVRQAPLATILPLAAMERSVNNSDLAFTRFQKAELQRKLYIGFSNERELTKIERDFTALLRANLGFAFSGEAQEPEKS